MKRTLIVLVVLLALVTAIGKALAAETPDTVIQALRSIERELKQKWKEDEEAYIKNQQWKHDQANRIREVLCQLGDVTRCPEETPEKVGETFTIDVTSYNPERGQTDNSPCIGAGLLDLCHLAEQGEDTIALSQDLVGRVDWKPFTYGDWVVLEHEDERCSGTFWVMDTMNERFSHRGDIFRMSRSDNHGLCKGAKVTKITL